MSKEPPDLARCVAEIMRLRRRLDALEHATDLFVTDEEMDSAKGNPKIRFDPKGFPGEKFKGKLASEATPVFLDAYSKTLMWFSENPKPMDAGLSEREYDEALKKQEKSAKFDKLDAKRCRSWARRKRLDGWKPPPPPPEPAGLGDLPALGGDAPSLGGDPFLSSDQALAEAAILGGGTGLTAPPADDSDLAGPWDAPATETPKVSDVAGDDLDGLPE